MIAILIGIIGKTHGVKFKANPPIKIKITTNKKPDSWINLFGLVMKLKNALLGSLLTCSVLSIKLIKST